MTSPSKVLTGSWSQGHAAIATDAEKARTQLDIYLAGQRTLDARNRTEIRQKKFLACLCGALLGINIIQAVENVRNSAKSHLIPYIVQTDQRGRIINAEILKDRSVDENFTATKTITAELASWVQDWRTVTVDILAQKSIADRVFSMVAEHSEGSVWLLSWFRSHDPVDRAKSVHVDASVKNILPQSLNTYEVYWEERETNLTSQTATISHWRSVITLSINPPKNEADVHRNRFGLYIERLTDPQKELQ
jgi:type IV secretory pathway TrbF-like protein